MHSYVWQFKALSLKYPMLVDWQCACIYQIPFQSLPNDKMFPGTSWYIQERETSYTPLYPHLDVANKLHLI